MQGKKLMHFGLRWYFYTDKKGQNSWIPQDRKWLAQCTPFLVSNLRYNCRKIRLKCQVIVFSTNPTKWEELTNSKSEHAWCNCLHVCTAKVWNVRWLANLWRNVYLTPEHMSPTRHGVHWANHFLSCGIHEFWPFFFSVKTSQTMMHQFFSSTIIL